MTYHDVSLPAVLDEHAERVAEIRDRGLVYPVTVIDGTALYDGAVSYPAILRAVSQRLEAAQTTEA
jgi:disulfide oxidoreductase YuzD